MTYPLPDAEILFRRMKSVAMHQPARSAEYLEFVHEEGRLTSQGSEAHHVFGSLGSLKSSDYCTVPVKTDEHDTYQNERGWLLDKLPQMLYLQLKYICKLEAELRMLRHNPHGGKNENTSTVAAAG